MKSLPRIALFCSGSGSNAQKIIDYFAQKQSAEVALLLANTPKAYALERAKNSGIATHVFSRADFYESAAVIEKLRQNQIDLIVLAGFLWLVPASLITAFPNKIINIHPALLPKFGGKGMYGSKVHEAVKAAKEVVSGITIHLIDQEYDKGEVLFQAHCSLEESDTPTLIAEKVLALEHQYFAPTIELFLEKTTGNLN